MIFSQFLIFFALFSACPSLAGSSGALVIQTDDVFREPSNQLIRSPKASNEDIFDDFLKEKLESLLADIRDSQAKVSKEYKPRKTYPPLISWSRQAGIYDSFVHLNFHGKLPQSALLRNA